MISFIAPNLVNDPNFNELKTLDLFYSVRFKLVWETYRDLAKSRARMIGKPSYRLGAKEINVMSIRMNPEISFNEKQFFYNDLLIIQIHASDEFFIFKVTTDPKGKVHKIAHLLEGIYASYKANRPHRWVPGRTAIVQDRDSVIIARTDSKGNTTIKENTGAFGINIHDSDKYLNSSMGCTVLEPDSIENDFQFKKHFKPLILDISNKLSIDYAIINIVSIKSILESIRLEKPLPLTFFASLFPANTLFKVVNQITV